MAIRDQWMIEKDKLDCQQIMVPPNVDHSKRGRPGLENYRIIGLIWFNKGHIWQCPHVQIHFEYWNDQNQCAII
ncbi:unnamed protein product [Thlaspi arvense]|uniref:Transposase n=1 Tax=Thlaspi arvense TaxID=13288 RepID=A0AAU9SGM2_THLAR|nr:unnamed protein product [Thlaspi arvense]